MKPVTVVCNKIELEPAQQGNVMTAPGFSVVGGGFRVQNQWQSPMQSFPSPDFGYWSFEYAAQERGSIPLDLYAVCGVFGNLQLAQTSEPIDATNQNVRASAVAPSGMVVLGGGFKTAINKPNGIVRASFPCKNGTGWNAVFYNSGGATGTLTAYAVCATKPKGYKSQRN